MDIYNEKFIDCNEAAVILNLTPTTVRRYLREKRITHLNFSGTKKIPMSAIVEFKKKSLVKAEK